MDIKLHEGRVNERIRFGVLNSGIIYYVFPKIKGWIKTKEFTVDATPLLKIYLDGRRECNIIEEAINSEDLAAALNHWGENRKY